MPRFIPLKSPLPEFRHGPVTISKKTVPVDDLETILCEKIPGGTTVTRLIVGRNLWMSDSPMEQKSNQPFVRAAHGDILIAGLGMGLILPPLLQRRATRSVTILEENPHIIEAISPHFQHPKLQVLQADAHKWRPKRGQKFDSIYLDIWPDYSIHSIGEARELGRRYHSWLRPVSPEAKKLPLLETWPIHAYLFMAGVR